MIELNVGDYIKGIEYYGDKLRRIRGWVDKIHVRPDGYSIAIQCDDSYKGHRGSMVHSTLGTVVKLKPKPRPITRTYE